MPKGCCVQLRMGLRTTDWLIGGCTQNVPAACSYFGATKGASAEQGCSIDMLKAFEVCSLISWPLFLRACPPITHAANTTQLAATDLPGCIRQHQPGRQSPRGQLSARWLVAAAQYSIADTLTAAIAEPDAVPRVNDGALNETNKTVNARPWWDTLLRHKLTRLTDASIAAWQSVALQLHGD